MASYFDWTATPDKNILHDSVRAHYDLEAVAANAERDTIAMFTYGYGETTVVALEGYDDDADSAEATLKEAMRLTVGEVANHRLLHYDTKPGVTSESRGARSETRKQVDPLWPDGWQWRLGDFEYAPVGWIT